MTFFEKELRKILDPLKCGAVYVGGKSAYIPLGDVKVRVDMETFGYADHYEGLLLRSINAKTGELDRCGVKFANVWGKRAVSNPNFSSGIVPHAWGDRGVVSWYVYTPTESDYKILREEVRKYIDIYR